jgi:hypothetical protein
MMSSLGKQTYDDQVLIRYLLGLLTAEETEHLDELSIADDEFALRLNVVENELVDAYVSNELSGQNLEQFKTFYLSSVERRQKVVFAEALRVFAKGAAALPLRTATPTPDATVKQELFHGAPPGRVLATPRMRLQWVLAGATLAILFAASYLFVQNYRLRVQMTETRDERIRLDQRQKEMQKELNEQRTANAQILDQLERARVSQTDLDQLKTVSLLLMPQTRGATGVTSVSLRPGTDLVVLVLGLESDDFPAYRVALKNSATDQVLWLSTTLASMPAGEKKAIFVSFRAGLLKQQNYIVELTGIPARGASELVGGYPFRAVLK